MADETEAIHTWFSLSYANYLVIPRAVLQSMPDEWQHRFVTCLEEMGSSFGHLDWPAYDVRACARRARIITPTERCEECDGKGFDAEGETCAPCEGLGEINTNEGERYETSEEVGVRTDPIPHYERGRTRLTPRLPTA